MKHGVPILSALAVGLLLGLGGCSDDDPVGPGADADLLVVIDFVESVLDEPYGHKQGYVFASDAAGAVLDAQRWDSPQRVELRARGPRPEHVTLTVVRDLGDRITFTSEAPVATGTSRQIPEIVWEEPEWVPVEFDNPPQTSRYVVATPHSSGIAMTALPDVLWFPVRAEASPGYLLVVAADGSGYAHGFPELRSTPSLDFAETADFVPVAGVDIAIPAGAWSAGCVLKGRPFGVAGLPTSSLDYIWYSNPLESIPDHLTVYPPPVDVADLATRFHVSFPGSPRTWYSVDLPGAPPPAIPYLEGEMTLLSARPDSLVVTADFAWDRLECFWRQVKDVDASWMLSAAGEGGMAALPEIPAEILADFPGIVAADFRLVWWELFQDMPDGGVRSRGQSVTVDEVAIPARIGNPFAGLQQSHAR